ncbi:MAG: FAD-dependent oxidoreductase [Chloroflexi bacterium]|nr:FAD-dependent oxidoreductase [Chloroflexota bacterium]
MAGPGTDRITGRAKAGNRIVVVGRRFSGMEGAESLVRQGKRVCLVTRKLLGKNGHPLERNLHVVLRDRLIRDGVTITPNSPLFEVTSDGVYIVFGNRELMFIEADTVVLAVGAKPVN